MITCSENDTVGITIADSENAHDWRRLSGYLTFQEKKE